MSWYASVELPWHVHYEHQLSAAYHWTTKEIDQTVAIDCLCHLILIRRREAADRHWAVIAGCFSDIKEAERQRITSQLQRQMNAGNRRLSEYEVVDSNSRVIMIGNMLRIHGDRWAEKHGQELAWLSAQGVSREEAMSRSLEWERKQMDDPFWQPGSR